MAKKQRFSKCNLRNFMKDKDLTLKDLGEYLGVSMQQVQKYANGENEMSLKMLLEACKKLECSPTDIYPEIELYDNAFSIPKTQTQPQSDNKSHFVTNNYYGNNISFMESLRKLFGDIKILDANALGIKLLKIAFFIIIIDDLLYMGFRALGYSYAPLANGTDHLAQLTSAWIIFAWPISLVAPLIIRHWLIYVLPLLTFRGIILVTESALNMNFLKWDNTISSQQSWLIHTLIALVFTLIYAWFVNKYLRRDSGKKKQN